VGTIAVAASPSCAVESPDGNHLYIADHHGAVTAVPVAAPVASLPAELVLDDIATTPFELEPV
ncbi:MAG: YncE family protein, partial [Mycobacterium sp.]